VRIISLSLPSGSRLYLKPHPHYGCTDQSIRALRKAHRISNVKVIKSDIPPMDLIRNARAVITINSTTGFESLILGVPVITFGHDFYCKQGICSVVRDVNDLPRKIQDAIKETPNRTVVDDFIKSVYRNTIWIDGLDYEYGFHGLSEEDGRKVAFAMNSVLDSIDGTNLRCS